MSKTEIRITRVSDGDELAAKLEAPMSALGQAVGNRMQRLVPKRTWALHDSITAETERSGATVTTTVGFGGDDVDYGLLVERGTSRAMAQPFARPALLQSKAGDLRFAGRGIVAHGVIAPTTRRSRVRKRREG